MREYIMTAAPLLTKDKQSGPTFARSIFAKVSYRRDDTCSVQKM